jgi:hypothetical protein
MKYLRTRADQTRGGEVPWGPGPPNHKERKHVLTQYTLQKVGGGREIQKKEILKTIPHVKNQSLTIQE